MPPHPADSGEPSPERPLARLAALHGVATSYSPSPDRAVAASDDAVVAVLAALDVDASTPRPWAPPSRHVNGNGANGCCRRPWSAGPTASPPPR